MKPIKILRLNRKHLSQMTYYFTSFQDNSCSHDGQSSICRIHSMQYIPVTPNMRDYNLLDSLGVAPDLERILDDYAQMIFFIKKGLYYAEFFEKIFYA